MNDRDLDRRIDEFEDDHRAGATSQDIIGFLRKHGVRFSEATFRKYVQLGLLPRSRRVGAKGKHQGSWGLYPGWTARQVVRVKEMLADGRTIEEISGGMLGVMVDCLGIATDLGDVSNKLERIEDVGRADPVDVRDMKGLVREATRNVERAAEIAREGRDMVEIAI